MVLIGVALMKNKVVHFRNIFGLFLSFLWCLPIFCQAPFSFDSFAAYGKKIAPLKTYPELHYAETQGSWAQNKGPIFVKILEKFSKETPVISIDELIQAITEVGKTNGKIIAQGSWVDNKGLDEHFFTKPVPVDSFNPIQHTGYYQPFTQTLVLDDDEIIVLHGDLHAGVHSLIKAVEPYVNAHSFVLRNPKMHLVFLGDLVDFGIRSVEVLYLLARLVTANPHNVHVTRGNHEDIALNRGGLAQELKIKYSGITPEQENKIYRFYDYLPTALWVG